MVFPDHSGVHFDWSRVRKRELKSNGRRRTKLQLRSCLRRRAFNFRLCRFQIRRMRREYGEARLVTTSLNLRKTPFAQRALSQGSAGSGRSLRLQTKKPSTHQQTSTIQSDNSQVVPSDQNCSVGFSGSHLCWQAHHPTLSKCDPSRV